MPRSGLSGQRLRPRARALALIAEAEAELAQAGRHSGAVQPCRVVRPHSPARSAGAVQRVASMRRRSLLSQPAASGGADRSLVQWVERRLEEVGGPLGDAGPAAWTPSQVVAWLRTSPMMAEHAAAFAADEVDGAALLTLDEVDLLALGVGALGERKRLLHAIAELRRAAPVVGASAAHADGGAAADGPVGDADLTAQRARLAALGARARPRHVLANTPEMPEAHRRLLLRTRGSSRSPPPSAPSPRSPPPPPPSAPPPPRRRRAQGAGAPSHRGEARGDGARRRRRDRGGGEAERGARRDRAAARAAPRAGGRLARRFLDGARRMAHPPDGDRRRPQGRAMPPRATSSRALTLLIDDRGRLAPPPSYARTRGVRAARLEELAGAREPRRDGGRVREGALQRPTRTLNLARTVPHRCKRRSTRAAGAWRRLAAAEDDAPARLRRRTASRGIVAARLAQAGRRRRSGADAAAPSRSEPGVRRSARPDGPRPRFDGRMAPQSLRRET